MRIIFIVLLLAGLAACGQKGPLYLPDEDADEDTELRQ